MRYRYDHDFHIHSNISPCASDPAQTPENILKYAEANHLRQIVIADHFWDTAAEGDRNHVWEAVPFEAVASVRPLPQGENTRFLFGCETDMDEGLNIGIHKDHYDSFDFIVVPTTHMHLWYPSSTTIPERAKLYRQRFERVLNSDLPLRKVGIAHPTCSLMANMYREAHLEVLRLLSDGEFEQLFLGAREKGCGIEINFSLDQYEEWEKEIVLRPYRIAKDCGCKFYLASDSHTFMGFAGVPARLNAIIDALGLTEEEKYYIPGRE